MKKQITIVIDDECKVFRAGIKAIFNQLYATITYKEISHSQQLGQILNIDANTVFFVNTEQYSVKDAGIVYKKIAPSCKHQIIFYYPKTQHSDVQRLFDHLNGISFIQKDAMPGEFLMALEQILQGGLFYCSKTLQLFSTGINEKRKRLQETSGQVPFTRRELQIISLICTEHTAKEIADKLRLSKRTVENHKMRIMEKMQVKNMAGIVKFALENDMIGTFTDLENKNSISLYKNNEV